MSRFKKSNFSITCERLNKYIKEKKSFSDNTGSRLILNTIISQQTTQGRQRTLELFPGIEFKEENKTCATPGTLQLTILYNGEVVNYDNIDSKKAEELFSFARSITTLRKVRSNVVKPMARRKSLQHFLQKRKDRISYNSAPYSSKQAATDDKSWLQLGLSN